MGKIGIIQIPRKKKKLDKYWRRNNRMNLQKKCRCKSCHEFFPADLLSIDVFCPKCLNSPDEYIQLQIKFFYNHLKKTRSVSLDVFDMFDLDRPNDASWAKFERVCKICGKPLKKKDGSYSGYLRYCQDHRGHGEIIFSKYNWQYCSKAFIKKIQYEHRKLIKEKLEALSLPYSEVGDVIVICEECKQICQIADLHYYSGLGDYKKILTTLPIINVHHKVPVHTLNKDNITLIWDFSNLICLCTECHHDKHRSRNREANIIDLSKQYKTIDKFL